MPIKLIANSALGPSDVPSPSDPEMLLNSFALSFNGYKVWGQDNLGTMARGWKERWRVAGEMPPTLTETRGCLFWEQRVRHWVYQSVEPPSDQIHYEHSLLLRVRALVEKGVADDEQTTVTEWLAARPTQGSDSTR